MIELFAYYRQISYILLLVHILNTPIRYHVSKRDAFVCEDFGGDT